MPLETGSAGELDGLKVEVRTKFAPSCVGDVSHEQAASTTATSAAYQRGAASGLMVDGRPDENLFWQEGRTLL